VLQDGSTDEADSKTEQVTEPRDYLVQLPAAVLKHKEARLTKIA
jgi:hypothetical protein